jgi:hypothetical protein
LLLLQASDLVLLSGTFVLLCEFLKVGWGVGLIDAFTGWLGQCWLSDNWQVRLVEEGGNLVGGWDRVW